MTRERKTSAPSPEEESFQQFLFEMDDVLEDFLTQANESGFNLDYSIESLDQLEVFIEQQRVIGEGADLLKNRAARYLGEVFRRRVGGQWELCLKHPKYLYYKLPVITGYSASAIEFCPIAVVANLLKSPRKGLLRDAVDSHLEFKK